MNSTGPSKRSKPRSRVPSKPQSWGHVRRAASTPPRVPGPVAHGTRAAGSARRARFTAGAGTGGMHSGLKRLPCRVCGAQLPGPEGRQYCSVACKSRAYRARHGDAWRARHRERARRRQAERRARDGPCRKRLSSEDLAAIASAPATMTAAELAHDLALPRELVAWNLRRFRSEGGWFCVLKLPPCTECGGPVVGPPKLMTHQACLPARKARWVREKRQQLKATLSPEALTERRSRA